VLLLAAFAVSAPTASLKAPTLSVRAVKASEDTKRVVFTVRLSRTVTGRVTVRYTTADGSGNAGRDYLAAKGTLVFRAGERLKRVGIAVVDDPTAEPEETLFIVLSRARGARIATPRAVGVIGASDLPAPFRLHAAMDGTQEGVEGDATARANALLEFDAEQERMSYTLTIESATRAFTVAHIHRGRPGSISTPLLRFEELPASNGTISRSRRVELGAILEIHAEPHSFWFQLHTAEGSTEGTIGGPLVAAP
jgi:hypothetical protein